MADHSDSAVAISRGDRASSLEALHRVEGTAASPGVRRPEEWRDDLLGALLELETRLHEQHQTAAGSQGLLTDLLDDAPHLASSVGELLERLRKVTETVVELRQSLSEFSRPFDVEQVRYQLANISREVRELRTWETEIVYEAYSVDLGVGD